MRGLFLLISFVSFLTSAQATGNHPYIQNLEKSFIELNQSEREHFHLTLIKILSKRAKGTKYSFSSIPQKKFSYSPQSDWLSLFIYEAVAETENSEIYCNFGGWISTLDKSRECLPPWSSKVRQRSTLEAFGPQYDRNYSCGGAQLFRCNPVLFGPGDREDGKGYCATADDNDPRSSTEACMEKFLENPETKFNHLNKIATDPQLLAQYIGIAAETMRFCERFPEEFPYCEELSGIISELSDQAVGCMGYGDLVPYIPAILTPFNKENVDQLARAIGTQTEIYMEDLRRRQREVRERNKAVYEAAIYNYTEDERTKAIIERVRENAPKCLMDSCKRLRGNPNTKSKYRSLAYCARYVKYAMHPPGNELAYSRWEEYPWGQDAVESGAWLRDQGFTNLMDLPEMGHITPENAPEGAIIVYEDVSPDRYYNVDGERMGGPGHIEIKASEDEYISDFINDSPTRIGGLRKPIGVYIRVPPEFEDEIQEVPKK